MFKKIKDVESKKQKLEKYEKELNNKNNHSNNVLNLKIDLIKKELKNSDLKWNISILIFIFIAANFLCIGMIFTINFHAIKVFDILNIWLDFVVIFFLYLSFVGFFVISLIEIKNEIYLLNLEKEEILEQLSYLYCEI